MTPYDSYRLRLPLRVRWAEVDLQGVVFNGHYLTYCDVCVTEYWRALEYHAPARYDEELEVCGRTARLGTTSLVFEVGMFRRERATNPLIEAELVYVNTDPSSRTTQPLPAQLRERVREFETTAPQENAARAAH